MTLAIFGNRISSESFKFALSSTICIRTEPTVRLVSMSTLNFFQYYFTMVHVIQVPRRQGFCRQSMALTNYDMPVYGYKYETIQNEVLIQADGWAASGHN